LEAVPLLIVAAIPVMDCSVQAFCKTNPFAQPYGRGFKATVVTVAIHPPVNCLNQFVKIALAVAYKDSATANLVLLKSSHSTVPQLQVACSQDSLANSHLNRAQR